MCKAAGKALNAVKGLISKIWKAIKPYLAYIVFIVILFFPYLAPFIAEFLAGTLFEAAWATLVASLPTAFTATAGALTWEALAVRGIFALAAAYVIDSSTGVALVQDIGKVGAVVGTIVGGVLTDTAGGLLKGIAGSSSFLWVALAIGGYFLFTSKKESTQVLSSDGKEPKKDSDPDNSWGDEVPAVTAGG